MVIVRHQQLMKLGVSFQRVMTGGGKSNLGVL